MIKVIMNGCNGHMGKVICNIIKDDKDAQIAAGVDVVAGNAPFPTFVDINHCDMPADVIIDFSTAGAVPNVIKYAVNKKIPVVICTTGLSNETIDLMDEAAKAIPVFRSANMSLGINLIAAILKRYSSVLYEAGFDVEITERHHNQKIDAPSGTALLLGDAVNESCGNSLEYIYDRSCVREKRSRNQLGYSAVRGGTIVGEHEVIFAGKDEVVELKHSAYSKEVFAVGAVKAAKYLVGKQPGKYDMQDVMSEIQ